MLKKSLSISCLLLSFGSSYCYASQTSLQYSYINNMQQIDRYFASTKASNFNAETVFPAREYIAFRYINADNATLGFNWNNNIP